MKQYSMILFTLLFFTVVASAYTTEGVSNTQTTTGASTTTNTASSSSSSTSSTPSITTNEPISNIECSNRTTHNWYFNTSIKYTFSCDSYSVTILPKISIPNILLKLEILKNKSNNTPSLPPNIIYKYFNLYSASPEFNTSVIRFRVPISWLSDKQSVTLMRYSNTWNPIPTAEISSDSDYKYYESHTTAFSNFAITAILIPTPTPTPTPEPTLTPTPTHTINITSNITITASQSQPLPLKTIAIILIILLIVVILLILLKLKLKKL